MAVNAIRIEKAVAIGARAQGVVSLSQWTGTEVGHLIQKRQTACDKGYWQYLAPSSKRVFRTCPVQYYSVQQ